MIKNKTFYDFTCENYKEVVYLKYPKGLTLKLNIMTTLNQQLETIKSFNNTDILNVDFFSWGGAKINFIASKFAADGIKRELGIKLEKLNFSDNEYMFVSMLPNC